MKYVILTLVLLATYFLVASMIGDMLKRRFSSREEIADEYERLRPYLRYRGGRK